MKPWSIALWRAKFKILSMAERMRILVLIVLDKIQYPPGEQEDEEGSGLWWRVNIQVSRDMGLFDKSM